MDNNDYATEPCSHSELDAEETREPTREELEAIEYMYSHPENLKLGIHTVDGFIPYYRSRGLAFDKEFDAELDVSVGITGDTVPRYCGGYVVLGISGTSGTRLVNVVFDAESARTWPSC